MKGCSHRPFFLLLLSVLLSPVWSNTVSGEEMTRAVGSSIPRREDRETEAQRGDFMVVPIPVSEPTLGTGLVLGGAYFYRQTEAQAEVQPPSVTGVAGLYTSNDSFAYGLGHRSYWDRDRWRFGGALAHANLRLNLVQGGAGGGERVDWRVKGELLILQLARRVAGAWFLGGKLRYLEVSQEFGLPTLVLAADLGSHTRSSAVGLTLERDTRDLPFNPYTGSHFQLEGLVADEILGSTRNYQSYRLAFRSYHQWAEGLVLAWEIEGCHREGLRPLWDSCSLGLRGFPVTDYLGRTASSAQVEGRWHFSRRWGLVAFGGAGHLDSAVSELRHQSLIPSYGAGVRFMVLPAERINIRLDYARSTGSDAIYFAVGEAF